MVNLVSSFIVFIMLFFSPSLYAEEIYDIKKLMLTSPQRADINKQRHQFYPTLGNRVEANTTKKKITKRKKLPKQLSVSSVIVSPSGKKIVRVNGHYSERAPRNSRIIPNQTSAHVTKFSVDGRRVEVPTGKTYLVKKKKLVSNHLYQAKQRQQKLRMAEKKKEESKSKEQENKSNTSKVLNKLVGK